MDPVESLQDSYRVLIDTISGLDDDDGWLPTGCVGWCVRDLVFHLLGDAQRALVALHSPTSEPPDVDAVTYWGAWQPGTPGAATERRSTRIAASLWSTLAPLADLYTGTAHAVLVAAAGTDPARVITTQGHRLTAGDLFRTLTVEATVHALDLRMAPASPTGLREVRSTLDGLLGRPAPFADSAHYALVGTGREVLTEIERAQLGADADRFPLFG